MIPVYICEDNENELEMYRKLILRIIATEGLKGDMEIICATQDPSNVLKHVKEDMRPAIYFLDVDLGPGIMNGIELGVNIRILDPSAYIVMVTTHTESAPLTYKYKIGAKDYILKDTPAEVPERIRECIKDGYKLLSDGKYMESKIILVRKDGEPFTMYANQIYYIEAVPNTPRKIWVHEKHCQTVAVSTLNDVKKQLDKSFYKCHKSYVININHVKGIEHKTHTVYLDCGHQIPISIRNLSGLEKHYLNFMLHKYN